MRVHRLLLVVFVLFVARPQPVQAWNPLKAISTKAKVVGRALGDVLGVGGFVESATQPTIRNVEDAGRRLVHDTEDAIRRRVDHAGSVTSRLLAETNRDLADRLAQVDRSLEARLLQVEVSGNQLVDHAFGRLDRSLGRLDAIARRRIDQIADRSKELIDHANGAAMKLIAEADAVLTRRLEDVRELVQSSIQEADAAAEARIAQLDEVAGRRIGNLDVVATKMSLNAERSLLRISTLVAFVMFLAFALWRIFVEAGAAWQKTSLTEGLRDQKMMNKVAHSARQATPRLGVQLVLAGAAAAALYLLADYLPKDAEQRAAQQTRDHEEAIQAALTSYDFAGVKYHASQLAVLRPDATAATRAIVWKADLLQTVFTRPAVLQTVGGVRQVMADLAALERDQPAPDPDVLVLKAFVLWQVGATRADEYEAATLCADALAMPATGDRAFMLASLAYNYLGAFLHDPYEQPGTVGSDLQRLGKVFEAASELGAQESAQFQHVVEYNRLVVALDRASSAAYLDMLSAHADYLVARQGWKKGQPETAEMTAARQRRKDHAHRVVEAWRVFDEELETSPWLAEDPTALAAFTLDDAVLSRALYFEVKPDATDLPAEFLGEGAAKLPHELRVKTAPLRVAWARRYATLIGASTQDLLAFEETARFRELESRAHGFELAYTSFLVATRSTAPAAKDGLAQKASDAALAAARMGLHRDTEHGRVTEAAYLLDAFRAAGGGDLAPELTTSVAEAYATRRLRFL